MKNKLIDLNNHLFAQLERLSDESLKGEKLSAEIQRTQAMSGIAKQVISNASLALKAQKMKQENLIESTPEMIGLEHNK